MPVGGYLVVGHLLLDLPYVKRTEQLMAQGQHCILWINLASAGSRLQLVKQPYTCWLKIASCGSALHLLAQDCILWISLASAG